MPKPRLQVTTTMSETQLAALDDFATSEDVSRADAIRTLLRLGLDRWHRTQRTTGR